MKIFLDSARLDEVKQAVDWGIIDGVTTNPSHVKTAGGNPSDIYPEICRLVSGPVSIETIATDTEGIVREGRALAEISDNVIVKVPVIKEGIKAIRILSSEGISTNATINFTPLQALLAAKAGATYISPFIGRLDSAGQKGIELVDQIRKIFDNYGFETQLLTAAIRHPEHVLQSALIGADACTMGFPILSGLYDHHLTDLVLQQFLGDWENVPKWIGGPYGD
ncbi:MAG: fructose-6-phosphate aldolase [Spirochaetes bacterium]|nr:MAG: fructose-6-phosphate aldolase [Spirochaetota bacterium]RKX77037.1 MAG: fructose-6-phosphate aldolase [Spirochaetota bacterium]RKX84395.1 MAG: fructose-6-phosphate aldolase [Spirochaetota bacterium]RKX98991.1 MAG: fructose-6-phosphate aldolase [Spirochaetota bacterium]